MANYYSVLGVSWGADIESIKTAYRRLAKRYHPDVSDDMESGSDRFERIRAAYEVLSDPIARQAYDRTLWRVRRARRFQLLRSASVGISGGVLVSLLLLGHLPGGYDTQSIKQILKSTIFEQRVPLDDSVIVNGVAEYSHAGAEVAKPADALADPDADVKPVSPDDALREIRSEAQFGIADDRLIRRFALGLMQGREVSASRLELVLPDPASKVPDIGAGAVPSPVVNSKDPVRNHTDVPPTTATGGRC